VNKQNDSNLLEQIMHSSKYDFSYFVENKKDLRIQVLYTKIDRDEKNIPHFTDYNFNADTGMYFYPASTVKFPAALLALERLNNLNLKGVDKYTLMDAGGRKSTDTSVLKPKSVAQLVKEILLVSDNNAFNTLFEFLGQQYINETLAAKGYAHVEIKRRLQLAGTEEDNRRTNAIRFIDENGKVVYEDPAKISHYQFPYRQTLLGKGYLNNKDSLINSPFDFSNSNKIYLQDLHSIMRSAIFPEAVDSRKKFNLNEDDYKWLYRYMSAYPSISKYPVYAASDYWDTYCKFLVYGSDKIQPVPYIRIFNKVGDAYGFLIDITYVADFKNKVEFFLSAVIYCNRDEIFNDDKYDYDSVGYPFMKKLGLAVYEYELSRKRKHQPDLSKFEIDYSNEK
jgi:hypothetical protein